MKNKITLQYNIAKSVQEKVQVNGYESTRGMKTDIDKRHFNIF